MNTYTNTYIKNIYHGVFIRLYEEKTAVNLHALQTGQTCLDGYDIITVGTN